MTCVTCMSPTNGFSTETHVGAMSSRRTITSTCNKGSATGPTRASVSATYVDHSWTLNTSTVKPAALLKPPEDTTLAFTAFFFGGPTIADPGVTTELRGFMEAQYYYCCPGTQRGSGRVCGILQRSTSSRGCTQAAFDSEISHYKRQIPDLRVEG